MTGRLSDVEASLGTVRKLKAVISAMRGIAAAHTREAMDHVESIQVFSETIGEAIGRALAFLPTGDIGTTDDQSPGVRAAIVIAAEQGFAGNYSEQVIDAAADALRSTHRLYLAGGRGLMIARERGLSVDWSAPMITHPAQATALATRLGNAISDDMAGGKVSTVCVIHARPSGEAGIAVVTRQLVPFDFSRFPIRSHGVAPQITLPPETLLSRLAEEYIFSELSEAVMLAFAAENAARMRAMILAHDKVTTRLDDLVGTSRRLRQEEITDEIVELSSGAMQAN